MSTNNNLILSNPSTVRLSERRLALIPTEGGNTLLLKLRKNKVRVSIIDDNTDVAKLSSVMSLFETEPRTQLKETFLFEIDKLNMFLSDYTEDVILPMIVEFLYEYNMIDETTFVEKLLILKKKYSVEYIISSLSAMSTYEINQIMTTEDDTTSTFESFI